MKKTPPTVKGTFLGGNLKDLQKDHLGLFYNSYKMYGEIVRFRFGPSFSYLLIGPEYVKHVLITNQRNYSRKSRVYKYWGDMLGGSIAFTEGVLWQKQRRAITPIFKADKLAEKVPSLVESVNHLVLQLDRFESKKEEFDLYIEMNKAILHSFEKSFIKLGTENDLLSVIEYKKVMYAFLYHRMKNIFNMPRFIPTKENVRYKKAKQNILNLVQKIVERGYESRVEMECIFSALTVSRDEIKDPKRMKQAVSELLGYIIMGHETTSIALTWTLYLLAINPKIEERVREEICSAKYSANIENTELATLSYCEQVIMESLRLYPPAWMLTCKAVNQDIINGYEIPRNATVNLCMYVSHRQKEYWKDPQKFDPDRFSAENRKSINSFAYFPFGRGQHNCVGGNYFIQEAKMVLVKILRNYRFKLTNQEKIEPEALFTLRPKTPIRMILEKC